jgi:hypothetical protein
MFLPNYRLVESWKESDLSALPKAESDQIEFKSSQIMNTRRGTDDLRHEISKAASAFWNTGGGLLIIGIDKSGEVDGGIPTLIGRQVIRDWLDQVIFGVQPVGSYAIGVIPAESSSSQINQNNAVLAIAFDESQEVPHMANDNIYYIRAGAHSVPASHYLVEALRSRRSVRKPILRCLLRRHEKKDRVIELVVMSANHTPAFDVRVSFEPAPKLIAEHPVQTFPLEIGVLDENHPFRMDVGHVNLIDEFFGKDPIKVNVEYADIVGNKYFLSELLDPLRNLSVYDIGTDPSDSIERALKNLLAEIKSLRRVIEYRLSNFSTDE